MVFNHVGVMTWDWETGRFVWRVDIDILFIFHLYLKSSEKARYKLKHVCIKSSNSVKEC